MALLLAPYNNAMRLGMGFNSFTQQLCINDAVQKPSGDLATEEDLRSQPLTKNGKPSGVPQHYPSAETTSLGLQKTQAGTYVRKHSDGSQAEISQIVTWKSEFIDNVSEVMDSMNISGSLAIKVDAIGGGAKAEGHYINTESVKKSDLNFHIQVNVINQKLVADDVTDFVPIKKITAPQFRDVYGDSFISGFIEGGVLNALISVEMVNKKDVSDMGGSLALSAKFLGGAVTVEGEGAAKVTKDKIMSENKTTISVSWSGGGDIVPDSVLRDGWTMLNLREVAMSFADKVALCPQRTSAIITKYSSLRSFYEKTVNGTPLDYENAGVYAASLLDDYMDYKFLWKQLQTTASRMTSKNDVILNKRPKTDDMATLSGKMKTDYETRSKKYDDEVKLLQSADRSVTVYNPSASSVAIKRPEKPITQHKLEPYGDSLFAIEEARRDCRFEMIKIVREVDAVSEDPTVATDVDRQYQYLAPTLFKQLIPGEEVVDPKKLRDDNLRLETEKKELKEKYDLMSKQCEQAERERDEANTKSRTLSERLTQLESDMKVLQGYYDEKNKQLTELENNMETLQGQYDVKNKQCGEAEKERDESNHKLNELELKYNERDEQYHKAEKEKNEAVSTNQRLLQENIDLRKALETANALNKSGDKALPAEYERLLTQARTAEENKASLEKKNRDLSDSVAALEKTQGELTSQVKDLRDVKNKELTDTVTRLKADMSRVARCWNKSRDEAYCSDDVLEIKAIFYSGQLYTSQEIMSTFLLLGKTGVPFWVNDHLVRDDPWQGHDKSLVVVYRYKNETEPRVLAGGQSRQVRFERPLHDYSSAEKDQVKGHICSLFDLRGWWHLRYDAGLFKEDLQWG